MASHQHSEDSRTATSLGNFCGILHLASRFEAQYIQLSNKSRLPKIKDNLWPSIRQT